MTIFATDTPMHPDDRQAWWVSMKKAYMNNERAVNHFAVVPKYKLNLATKTRTCHTRHHNTGQPHQCAATGPDLRGGDVAAIDPQYHRDQARLSAARSSGPASPPKAHNVPIVSVSPTDGRKRGTDFATHEQRPSGLRFALVCALNAVGLVAGLALVFGLLVVLGAVMGAI